MKKTDTAESIMMLKQRFNQIKKNITMMEQKQSEINRKKSQNPSQPVQDSSQNKIQSKVRRLFTHQPGNQVDLRKQLQLLEHQNKELQQELSQTRLSQEEMKNRLQEMQETIKSQTIKISILTQENQSLKQKIRGSQEPECPKRPQSCMRNTFSTPKKNRVGFSKELAKFVHIHQNDCPKTIEKLKLKQQSYQGLRSQSPQVRKPSISPAKWKEKYSNFNRSHVRYSSGRKQEDRKALLSSMSQEERDFRFSDYYRERSRHLAQPMMGLE